MIKNLKGLEDAILKAEVGEKVYLSNLFFTPQDVYNTLDKLGYSCGEPDFLGRGSVVVRYSKEKSKDVRVYSSGLSFELFLTFSEPCNYYIDF